LQNLIGITKSIRPDFLVLAGEDLAFLPYLCLGGDGIISVTSQVAGKEMLALYQCVKNKDFVYARKIAHKINGLCKLLFSHPNPIPIKTLLASMGLIKKSWRSPLCSLLESEEKIFLDKCKSFEFIKNIKDKGLPI
jgi:4-hydroxy-tetrahydrodipicolinate synthase